LAPLTTVRNTHHQVRGFDLVRHSKRMGRSV
jgi:hypothetical protein